MEWIIQEVAVVTSTLYPIHGTKCSIFSYSGVGKVLMLFVAIWPTWFLSSFGIWAISKVNGNYPSVIFIAEIYDQALYRVYIEKGKFDYLYDKVGLYV